MRLCDIGNTSYHFYQDTQEQKYFVEDFDPATIQEKVYYICVNSCVALELEKLDNWIDLEPFIDRTKYYKTMGIDRIVAVEAIDNGIIIDAGSAITVDVVRDGVFEGGFIYPGIKAMQECYKNISGALDYSFNFELDLDKMAKNSQDAISYGYLKPFVEEVNRFDLPIYLTGGDADMFRNLLPKANLQDDLIFSGMKIIIKKANIC